MKEDGGGGLYLTACMLNFANYAAQVDEPGGAREFIEARCKELEKLLAL